MTFNEWFVEYNKTNGLPPAYVVAEDAWNAAVQACLDEVEGSWVLDYEDRSFTATMLQALKTPQEGSNEG